MCAHTHVHVCVCMCVCVCVLCKHARKGGGSVGMMCEIVQETLSELAAH